MSLGIGTLGTALGKGTVGISLGNGNGGMLGGTGSVVSGSSDAAARLGSKPQLAAAASPAASAKYTITRRMHLTLSPARDRRHPRPG